MLQPINHLDMLHLSLCLGHDCWCFARKRLGDVSRQIALLIIGCD
jgi:hypothetical protein